MRKTDKTEVRSILVTIDALNLAYYIKLIEGRKVVRTEVKKEWPLVAIDYAADGQIIGVECAGAKEFSLKNALDDAGVEASDKAISRAIFKTAAAA